MNAKFISFFLLISASLVSCSKTETPSATNSISSPAKDSIAEKPQTQSSNKTFAESVLGSRWTVNGMPCEKMHAMYNNEYGRVFVTNGEPQIGSIKPAVKIIELDSSNLRITADFPTGGQLTWLIAKMDDNTIEDTMLQEGVQTETSQSTKCESTGTVVTASHQSQPQRQAAPQASTTTSNQAAQDEGLCVGAMGQAAQMGIKFDSFSQVGRQQVGNVLNKYREFETEWLSIAKSCIVSGVPKSQNVDCISKKTTDPTLSDYFKGRYLGIEVVISKLPDIAASYADSLCVSLATKK